MSPRSRGVRSALGRAAASGTRVTHRSAAAQPVAGSTASPSVDVATAAAGTERLFAPLAVGVNAVLTVSGAWWIALDTQAHPGLVLVITVSALGLHLRHVLAGLRGERPSGGTATLAALALVHAAAWVGFGRMWAPQLAALVVSILLVVRGRRALLLAAAVCLAPLLLATEPWYARREDSSAAAMTVPYLVLAITWRAVTGYVPVRLAAAVRQLDAARRELEARAVARARLRIDGELRRGLGIALERITARGGAALAALRGDVGGAALAGARDELRGLVADARGALADARRVVAGYRAASLGAQLEAAAALLEAAGARARVVAAPDVSLDAPGAPARDAVRAAVARALGHRAGDERAGDDGRPPAYVIRVAQDAGGTMRVTVEPDHAGADAPGATEQETP